MPRTPSTPDSGKPGEFDMSIGLPASATGEAITARRAGDLSDLDLSISPRTQVLAVALRNLAKALNLALKSDYLETDLDHVYKAARVRKGRVEILHRDYIGLGDGCFASVGRAVRSAALTLTGPDAGSPEGKRWIEEHGTSSLRGITSLLGRKLNLLQEYEDMVPIYVQQTLDRLEAKRVIRDWQRNEWRITTSSVGLDVILEPLLTDDPDSTEN